MKKSKVILLAVCLITAMMIVSTKSVSASETKSNVCGKDIAVSVNILDFWENSYKAQIELTNLGAEVIDDWFISFVSTDNIYQIWNASINTHVNSTYVINHTSWNRDLGIGEVVTIEYIASYDCDYDLPHDFISVGICREFKDSYDVNYIVSEQWNGLVHGFIEVTNNASYSIDDWKLTCLSDCDSVWFTNASIDHNENGQIFIKGNYGNETITPKTTLTIEYYGVFDGNGSPISNAILYFSEPFFQQTEQVQDEISKIKVENGIDELVYASSLVAPLLGDFSVSINSSSYSKTKLITDLNSDYQEEVKNQGLNFLKELARPNSVEESVNDVLSYDSAISSASKTYKVKKEIIQSVLFREIAFLNILDSAGDLAVENYFINRELLEDYSNLSWWQQLLVGTPTLLYPEKEDSSTGLGQIFGKTAIKALNDPSLDPENWKDRKEIWYQLKDDPVYNINMCARILYNNAGKSLSSPSKQEIIDAAALYNRSTVSAGQPYGERIYKYYTYFKKYNK